MKGYSLIEAAARNKNEIKLFFSALVGVLAFMAAPLSPPWGAMAAAMIGFLSKLGADAIDFYFSDVKVDAK